MYCCICFSCSVDGVFVMMTLDVAEFLLFMLFLFTFAPGETCFFKLSWCDCLLHKSEMQTPYMNGVFSSHTTFMVEMQEQIDIWPWFMSSFRSEICLVHLPNQRLLKNPRGDAWDETDHELAGHEVTLHVVNVMLQPLDVKARLRRGSRSIRRKLFWMFILWSVYRENCVSGCIGLSSETKDKSLFE